MVPGYTRRSFLLGSVTAALPLAGCTALPGVDNPIDMTILNRSATEIHLGVTALRAGETEYSEAIELREHFTIPAATDSGVGELQREDILPSAAYTIQVEFKSGRSDQERHFHYYPDCTGGTESNGQEIPEDEFLLDIQPSGDEIIFRENTCSSDSWKL